VPGALFSSSARLRCVTKREGRGDLGANFGSEWILITAVIIGPP